MRGIVVTMSTDIIYSGRSTQPRSQSSTYLRAIDCCDGNSLTLADVSSKPDRRPSAQYDQPISATVTMTGRLMDNLRPRKSGHNLEGIYDYRMRYTTFISVPQDV